ncbi:hypothetical protein D3C74_223400 [compost metagenome]
MLSLSSDTVQRVENLTSEYRETAFIFDDSMFERNRSKAVEMLARFKDYATGSYYKGFRMLTMGWSDGHSFIPMDFALLSSAKSAINGMMQGVDKRTHGYKRREEALRSAPQVIAEMLDRAIQAGVSATYVLMDSWFTHAPLIQEVTRRRALHVICMVKNDNKRYLVNAQRLCLRELYTAATRVDLINEIATKAGKKIPNSIQRQLQQWIAGRTLERP